MELGSGGEGRDGLGPVYFLQDNIIRDASGAQYVALVQDGQTFGIPICQYEALVNGVDEGGSVGGAAGLEITGEVQAVNIVTEALAADSFVTAAVSSEAVSAGSNAAVPTIESDADTAVSLKEDAYSTAVHESHPNSLKSGLSVATQPSEAATQEVAQEVPVVPACDSVTPELGYTPIAAKTPVTAAIVTTTMPAKVAVSAGASMRWMSAGAFATAQRNTATKSTVAIAVSPGQKICVDKAVGNGNGTSNNLSRIVGTKAPFGQTRTIVIGQPPPPPSVRHNKINVKHIKVDNWGIFLLTRLQNYFQKKELCDLTIRFPERNAQIKVHRLVVNACTEYFSGAEKEGRLLDGNIDMPANFIPEAVAPIIRFMYTGRLEVKEESYDRLYETAGLLKMSVLTKLMDAQVNAPAEEEVKTPGRKRRISETQEVLLNQIRKIQKIEEQVRLEEHKSQKMERLKTFQRLKQDQEELDRQQRLPGKKLPIWRRKPESKINTAQARAVESGKKDSGRVADNDQHTLTEISPSPAPGFPYRIPRLADHTTDIPFSAVNSYTTTTAGNSGAITKAVNTCTTTTVGPLATYQKRRSPDKPKIPRRLREIQQHLMFEKILRTGAKNPLMQKSESEANTASRTQFPSPQEIKALSEEQLQRRATAAVGEDAAEQVAGRLEDEDDDDYFDNDVEYATDEYLADDPGMGSPAAPNIVENDQDRTSPAIEESPTEDEKCQQQCSSAQQQHSSPQQQQSSAQQQQGSAHQQLSSAQQQHSSRQQQYSSGQQQHGSGQQQHSSGQQQHSSVQQQQSSAQQQNSCGQQQQQDAHTHKNEPTAVVCEQREMQQLHEQEQQLRQEESPHQLHIQKPPHQVVPVVLRAPPPTVKENTLENVSKIVRVSLKQEPVLPVQASQRQTDKKILQQELDEALEEFSRVAEKEAEEIERPTEANRLASSVQPDPKRPRCGRPPKLLQQLPLTSTAAVATPSAAAPAAAKQEQAPTQSSLSQNQSKLVAMLLKKNPDLLKSNKPVKIKILAKDETGKSVTQVITVRPHITEISGAPSPAPAPSAANSTEDISSPFRAIPPVMYTGRRGRPKKVRPGMADPHKDERLKIKETLNRNFPNIAKQIAALSQEADEGDKEKQEDGEQDDQEEEEENNEERFRELAHDVTGVATAIYAGQEHQHHHQLLDPSSEAEAFNNVASGIAASLGLEQQQQQQNHILLPDQSGNLVSFPAGNLVVDGAGRLEGGGGGAQLVVEGGGGAGHHHPIQLLAAGQQIYQILTPEGNIQYVTASTSGDTKLGLSGSYIPVSSSGVILQPGGIIQQHILPDTPVGGQHSFLATFPHTSQFVSATVPVTPTSAELTDSITEHQQQQHFFQQQDLKSPDKTVARIVEDWGSDDET